MPFDDDRLCDEMSILPTTVPPGQNEILHQNSTQQFSDKHMKSSTNVEELSNSSADKILLELGACIQQPQNLPVNPEEAMLGTCKHLGVSENNLRHAHTIEKVNANFAEWSEPELSDDGIMVFRPTMEEFKNFNTYVKFMESKNAHHIGLAKIIPPSEWVPQRANYKSMDVYVTRLITQKVMGSCGLYLLEETCNQDIHMDNFKELANSDRHMPPTHTSYEELQEIYWKSFTFNAPIYGDDVCCSLTDEDQDLWNVQHLGSVLDLLNNCAGDENEASVEKARVNTPHLYFGMWKSTFAWHTEDMDLYSINYVHYGAPKSWYCIPPAHGKRFERLVSGFFPDLAKGCSAFMRHKTVHISPTVLKKHSIPVHKITQEAGEIMISFPYAYHAGFNHGFNCAESVNFATERWIEYGKRCTLCDCGSKNSTVSFSMDPFVKLYQPDMFDLWVKGEDRAPHPHDDEKGKLYPPLPSNKQRTSTTALHLCPLDIKASEAASTEGAQDDTGTLPLRSYPRATTEDTSSQQCLPPNTISPTLVQMAADSSEAGSPGEKTLSNRDRQDFTQQDTPIKQHCEMCRARNDDDNSIENSMHHVCEDEVGGYANTEGLHQPEATAVVKETSFTNVDTTRSAIYRLAVCLQLYSERLLLNESQLVADAEELFQSVDNISRKILAKKLSRQSYYQQLRKLKSLCRKFKRISVKNYNNGDTRKIMQFKKLELECVACGKKLKRFSKLIKHYMNFEGFCDTKNKKLRHRCKKTVKKHTVQHNKMDGLSVDSPKRAAEQKYREDSSEYVTSIMTIHEMIDKVNMEGFAQMAHNPKLDYFLDPEAEHPLYTKPPKSTAIPFAKYNLALNGLLGGAATGRCCEVCHKSFPSQRQYHKHVLIQHPTSGSYTCNLCSRAFTLEILLREHQQYVHQAVDRHRCHGCAREFACFGTWKAHVGSCPHIINGGAAHAGHLEPAPPAQFQCGVCDDRLDTMKKLLMHLNLHLPKQMSDDAPNQQTGQGFAVASTAAASVVSQMSGAVTTTAGTSLWPAAAANMQSAEAAAQYTAASAYLHNSGAYLGAMHHHGVGVVQAAATDQPATYWTAATVDAAGATPAAPTMPYQELISQMGLVQQQKQQQTQQQPQQQQPASQQQVQHPLFTYTTTESTLPLLDRSIMEPLFQNSPIRVSKASSTPAHQPHTITTTLPAATASSSGSATPTPATAPPPHTPTPIPAPSPQQPPPPPVHHHPQTAYFECAGCERLFTRVEALIDHHQSNHGVLPFQCCFCDTRFETSSALDRHLPTCRMDREQLPVMVFRCGRCWVAFGTALELMSHAQSCPLLPPKQQQALLAASAAVSPAAAAMLSPVRLAKASSSIRKTTTTLHAPEVVDVVSSTSPPASNSSSRSCYHCGKNFKRSSYLKAHLRRHDEWDAEAARTQAANATAAATGAMGEDGSGDHSCRLCGRAFTTRHSLVLHHARRHTPRPYRCVDCGRRFINSSNLRIHRRLHSGERLQFECVCGKQFAWKTALMSHRKRCQHLNGGPLPPPINHTPAQPRSRKKKHSHAASTVNAESIHVGDGGSAWMDQQNGAPRDEKRGLSEAVFWAGNYEQMDASRTRDSADYVSSTSPSSTAPGSRSCHHCGKHFKRYSYLKAHLKRHEEWDAEATKTQNAAAVGALPGDGSSCHACRLCGRTFETRHSLVLHHARRHTPRPYRCVDCGKRFINSASLRTHRAIHSGETLQYQCICGKSFAWKTALMSHRKRCQQVNPGLIPSAEDKKAARASTSTVNVESIQDGATSHAPAHQSTGWLDQPQNATEAPRLETKRLTEVFWAGNFELEHR